jgi:hypothetical protein
VDDKVRYKLIRALIETIRAFQRVRSVKIIIAARLDLLESVYRETQDSGFQEEKYESLYLPIRWDQTQLESLLDTRVAELVREQYTKRPVYLRDILPKRLGSKAPVEYVLDRTLMRPRDAILFLNTCLLKAEGKAGMTVRDVSDAESDYSVKRLRALEDEWRSIYPNISKYVRILEQKPFPFKIRSVPKDEIDAFILELYCLDEEGVDPVCKEARRCMDGERSINSFMNYLVRVMYKVGLVGIKTDSFTPTRWSHLNDEVMHEGEVKPASAVYVHPAFWRVLGIAAERIRGNIADIDLAPA